MHRLNRWSPHPFVILIVLLPFLLLWRWLFKGEVLFWGTSLLQFWPWRQLAKESLLAGQWPLWNPLLGNGTPLLANLQSAVFYPLNLVYLAMPVEHGLTFSVLLHLALAGLFMYLYGRRLALSPFAATVSALSYMLSGYVVGRTQFVTMVNAAAWLPLLLLFGERIVAQRAYLNVGGMGLVLAMPLLAGHAQLWFYGLWLAAAYTLFRSGQTFYQRAESLTKREQGLLPSLKRLARVLAPAAWRLGLAVGLAALLAAVQILPTAEFTAQSSRSGGTEQTFALTYSFWPWRLITLAAPDFFGSPATGDYWGYANYWEDHAYIGALPLLLALVAVMTYFRNHRVRLRRPGGAASPPSTVFDPPDSTRYYDVVPFFAGLVPVSLVLAMGWNTPVYLWVYDFVPGFGFFQAPARLLIWYTIAMAVLAGVGAQVFELTPAGRRGWRRLLVACGGISIAAAAAGMILTGRSQTFLLATLTLGVLLAISIILLLVQPKAGLTTSRRRARWQWSALIFIGLDLLRAALPLLPTLPASIYDAHIETARIIKSQPAPRRIFVDEAFDYTVKFSRYFRFDTFGPLEPAYWQGLKETLVPNAGVYEKLPAANNYDPLVIGSWQRLTELIKSGSEEQRARLLPLMGVGYFIRAADDGPRQPAVYQDDAIIIQPVLQGLPRAYFVPHSYPVANETEAVTRILSPDFDSSQEVVIMEDDAGFTGQSDLVTTGPTGERGEGRSAGRAGARPDQVGRPVRPVTVETAATDRVVLRVEAPAAGFVVLTDTFYPGWQATVDGRSTRIRQANLAFRAVPVEAGNHRIEFRYEPLSFKLGLWVSLGSWLLLIGAGAVLIFRKVGGRESGPDPHEADL